MNLLHVIASLNPATGGVAQAVRLVIPSLQSLGCNSEVVSLDGPDLAKTWSDEFTVHALGASRGPWAYHPDLMPWLEANLDRFDAVIVHGLWLFPSYAVWKAMREKLKAEEGKQKAESRKQKLESGELEAESREQKVEGRKRKAESGKLKSPPSYFVFPHGMLDPWFQRAPGRRLKALRNWIYWKLVETKVIRDAAGLLFTCEEERRLARTTFAPYAPQQEINVGYGIAAPPVWEERMRTAFAEKCPELQDRPYLLFLSRIHPKKGVDLLIRAYAKIVVNPAASAPDLVIAGPGLETVYGQEMQALAASLCPGRVRFPGMLSGDAKWGAFYGCEAFVLPSHQENFGIAVVEALACGNPVLISDQVNIWREIETAKAGLVAPDTDLGTLALLEKWSELTQVERDEMRRSARPAYETYFGIARAAENLLKALRLDDRLKQEIAA